MMKWTEPTKKWNNEWTDGCLTYINIPVKAVVEFKNNLIVGYEDDGTPITIEGWLASILPNQKHVFLEQPKDSVKIAQTMQHHSPDYIEATLRKSDLINMIMGTEPGYDKMDPIEDAGFGRYTGGFVDEWKWNRSKLEEIDDLTKLYKLYRSI